MFNLDQLWLWSWRPQSKAVSNLLKKLEKSEDGEAYRAEGDISKTRAGARESDVPLPRTLYKNEPIKLTNAFHAG